MIPAWPRDCAHSAAHSTPPAQAARRIAFMTFAPGEDFAGISMPRPAAPAPASTGPRCDKTRCNSEMSTIMALTSVMPKRTRPAIAQRAQLEAETRRRQRPGITPTTTATAQAARPTVSCRAASEALGPASDGIGARGEIAVRLEARPQPENAERQQANPPRRAPSAGDRYAAPARHAASASIPRK